MFSATNTSLCAGIPIRERVFVKLVARNEDTHVINTYTQEMVKQNMEVEEKT